VTERAPSLQRRLVLAVAVMMTVVISLVGVAMYGGAKRGAWKQFDDGLRARALALCALAEHDEDGYEMELPAVYRPYVRVYLPDGRVISDIKGQMVPNMERPRPPSPATDGFRDADLLSDFPPRPAREVQVRCMPRDESGGAEPIVLILAEDTENVTAAIDSVQRWFLLIAVLSVLATTAAAYLLVRRALSPLPQLATVIAGIDDKSLDKRLPLKGQPAELVAPVEKLNDLLARLSASFTRERQFTADVSHELRTPIAGLRTLLEVTSLADRSTTEYKTALADAQAIVLQLGALVDNLLLLARLDAGQIPLATSNFDLGELAAECWKPYAALAASRKLDLRNTIPTELSIDADREKLRSVLANLIANAVEYTEEGGWIELSSGQGTIIAVTDSGPPIPEEQLPRLFDRMWRGDAARAGTGVHCGIGLALAKSLCDAMGFALTARLREDQSVQFAVEKSNLGA
jgi:two-component system heavy metal sensor histidine kinase CusS